MVPIVEIGNVMFEMLQFNFKDLTNPRFEGKQDWCRRVHAGRTPEERQNILKKWRKIYSKHRILIVSDLSELELIVPDVGALIVLSHEGPVQMRPSWQRMARMEHQTGYYAQMILEREDSEGEDDACSLWWAQDPTPGCYRTVALKDLIRAGQRWRRFVAVEYWLTATAICPWLTT